MDQLDVKAAPPLGLNAAGGPLSLGTSGPTRLGTVVALVGAGLFVTGLGDALARAGHQAPALPMFFVGLVAIFTPCAWRLTSGSAARSERVAVSLVLGVGLLASYYMRSPLIFDWFDELIHGATLNRLLGSRTLQVHNRILPVSPYYPGLELLTVAVKWMTGLPVVLAQLVVVLAQRIVLVLCVFLVVERVCRSARAAGIGVLVYVANPSFYTFASWDYGPLALAFAVATVHFMLRSLDVRASMTTAFVPDRSAPSAVASRCGFFHAHRDFLLALASMAALVVTHHLTALLTAGLLVVWSLGLWMEGRPKDARWIGLSAASSVVLVLGWSAFVGSHLASYLGPIFSDASSGFSSAIGQHHSSRALFRTDSSQGGSSFWEIVVMLAAAVSFCLLLCPSVLAVIRKRTGLGGALRFVPVTVAAAYPFAMLASISTGSSQVGERTTTFIFFGMAIVIGGWLATRLSKKRTLLEVAATVLIATVCFLGSMIFGSGPDITYVPGPYLVAANQRSFGAPSLAVARWASTHLAAGSNVAADRQSGALVADFADVNLVTGISGLADPGPLFFSSQLDRSDLNLIRTDRIRYIVVDRRLASSPPLFGTYFEPGEAKPGTRITAAELSKFDSVPGIDRVYDNGPIQVYDLSRLLGVLPSPSSGPGAGATGTDSVVLAAAIAVAVVGFVRVRRRRGKPRMTDRVFVRWLVVSMVGGMVLAAATVPLHVSPTVIGLGGLAFLLVILLAGTRTRPSSTIPSNGGSPQPVATRPAMRREEWAHTAVWIAILVAGIVLARYRSRRDSAHPDRR
ncbi:MAG: hypothetical protein IVW52_04090 [Acidimicrobiales bacterium]|nr:hypothetical protein [Acidimicrobiales bacterium]